MRLPQHQSDILPVSVPPAASRACARFSQPSANWGSVVHLPALYRGTSNRRHKIRRAPLRQWGNATSEFRNSWAPAVVIDQLQSRRLLAGRSPRKFYMARQSVLPPTLMPRLINREVAAAYVSVSQTTFDEMVKNGRMPRPRRLGGRRHAWDVRALDAAVDRLPVEGGDADDQTWADTDAA